MSTVPSEVPPDAAGDASWPRRVTAQLMLIMTALAGAAYAHAALSPVQQQLQLSLGLSDNQLGLLQGATIAIPMLIIAVPLGLLIDSYSRVRLLQSFLLLGLIGSGLTAIAGSYGLLFLGRALVGIGLPATGIIAVSLVGDLFPPARRGRAFMMTGIGQLAGRSAAFALGGFLLSRIGGPEAWRLTIAILAVPLAGALLLLLFAREPYRRERAVAVRPHRLAFSALWQNRRVIFPLTVGLIMVVLVDTAVLVWVAPAFARTFEISPLQIGSSIATALLVTGIAGPIIGGFLVDTAMRRGGPRGAMTAMSMITLLSVPTGLFPLMPTALGATLLLTLFLGLGSMIAVMSTTLAAVAIPGDLRGLAMSVCNAIGLPISLGIAPLSVSLTAGALGGPDALGTALAIVASAISLLGAILFLAGRPFYPAHVVTEASLAAA